VDGVNTLRYLDNWNTYAPYLPIHGTSHSFYPGGGADTTWVYSRQFMPLLVYPNGGGITGTNVQVSPHVLLDTHQTWKYVGGTGTANLLQYIPSGTDFSAMILVYLDANTGNPSLLVNSGTYPSNLLTGTGDIYPYIPVPDLTYQIPLAAVRVSSGTHAIGWDNLYDVRQWLQTSPTGTSGSGGGGGSSVDTIGFAGLDEGIPIGTGTFLNVVGAGATFSRSGTMFNLNIPGSAGSSAGLQIFDDGVFVATGTAISFNQNALVSATGTTVFVDFPVTTYFRVGQPTYLTNPTGLFWKVPDGVYASGSLGVFVNGHALIPGLDYTEQMWISGTYQYTVAQPTGMYHLNHYGVPCIPQTQPGLVPENAMTDSNGDLLIDSNGDQILDG
jgi:hypothetical protein